MEKYYEKRFPADTTLEKLTFLNNRKIDAELYAYLQSISSFDAIENGENMSAEEKLQYCNTYILKKNLPTQKIIASKFGITEKTLRSHLAELIDNGFLVKSTDKKDIAYYLPMCENMYFMIPLETIQFLNDTVKEEVVKMYIYLGMKWQWVEYERSQGRQRENYSFTLRELGEHLGISVENNERNLKTIRNMLLCLENNGLIEYANYFQDTRRKRLVKFNKIVKGKTKSDK